VRTIKVNPVLICPLDILPTWLQPPPAFGTEAPQHNGIDANERENKKSARPENTVKSNRKPDSKSRHNAKSTYNHNSQAHWNARIRDNAFVFHALREMPNI